MKTRIEKRRMICLTFLARNGLNGKPVPELEAAVAAGDEFLVDYVRVYDIVEAK